MDMQLNTRDFISMDNYCKMKVLWDRMVQKIIQD